MKVGAIIMCAGINISICIILFSLYSILRKQPSNVSVYFGRRLATIREKRKQGAGIVIERLVPSASWIVKAWKTTEEELLTIGGLDAVVFCRILVFSIQIFSIAAAVCLFVVLPANYFGKEMEHKRFMEESLDVFSIGNIQAGSKWLWVHCFALYVISLCTCVLLYFNYKGITTLRLAHIAGCPPNPSHFAVLVRSIPWSEQESYSETLKKFFSKYHASGYLSHQMVYDPDTVYKLVSDADMVYKSLVDKKCKPTFLKCGICGSPAHSFQMVSEQEDNVASGVTDSSDTSFATKDKECAAAFVFFRTRFDAVIASQLLQSSHPMVWVTELAPEPDDVWWPNLAIPYEQLWLRQIVAVVASVAFVCACLAPVTFVQALTQIEGIHKKYNPLNLETTLWGEIITGYLPSALLTLFLYTAPPVIMFSTAKQGCISRSERKMNACCQVLYFTIWNVFFVNVLSGSVISQVVERPKEILTKLAEAVPKQASFFMALSLTSGWASLPVELLQICPLIRNWFTRLILRYEEDASSCEITFPYQVEIPRVLLFGLLGLTCSIMAPLILPCMLIYYIFAYFVYKNQFVNVYTTKYESGGRFWPIAFNTTVFSLVFTQVTAIGVFGLRRAPYASGVTIPLLIGTLLYFVYCRRRFNPIFASNVAVEVLIEMDLRDAQSGKLKGIYQDLHAAYCQFVLTAFRSRSMIGKVFKGEDGHSIKTKGKKGKSKQKWATSSTMGEDK